MAISLANGSYADALRNSGLTFRESAYWLQVGTPPAPQGWKLHLSVIPMQAEPLLAAVLPFLRDSGTCFKVARDCAKLEALNAGSFGTTQVGKFLTVYLPAGGERAIAATLVALTADFDGPAVPSDIRLGGTVHARYGSFVPQIRRDRLGLFHRQLQWPDGTMHDDVYQMPLELPEGIGNPFDGMMAPVDSTTMPQRLRAQGYIVLEVLRQGAKGATFLALQASGDGRRQAVVLKQARPHCMSDRLGRNARSRLAREEHVLRYLAGIAGIPRICGAIDDDGSAFLAIEFVAGRSIEQVIADTLARRQWGRCPPADRLMLLGILGDLAALIAAVHARGIAHRDLSNTNVQITPEGRVFLLDHEMAQAIDDPEPPTGSGTLGFRSPEQAAGSPAAFADDVHGFCALVLLALTGIDPRRLQHAAPAGRVRQIAALTGDPEELNDLIPLVARGLDKVAAERPLLSVLSDAIAMAQARLNDQGTAPIMHVPKVPPPPMDLIGRAIEGVLVEAYCAPDGLWLSPPLGAGDQGVPKEQYEKLRSAHSGVAGILYTLAVAADAGWRDTPGLARQAATAAQWLIAGKDSRDVGLPGLHFGEAGVGLAIHRALGAGLVKESPALRDCLRTAFDGPLDWPDYTHGAAGQGIAALVCAPVQAARCAEFLVDSQQSDGSWIVPEGAQGVAGQKLTGFAHGVAGIVYFLAEFAARTGNRPANAAMQAGIGWLRNMALDLSASRIIWPYSDRVSRQSGWWCHGAPGIALAFLKAYEATGDVSCLDIATRALEPENPMPCYGNVSFCHGLSGLGEIYLEAWRVTGDVRWQCHAAAMLTPILALGRLTERSLTWTVEDPMVVTADLALGCGGPLHFLLRLHAGTRKVPLPLTVPPCV